VRILHAIDFRYRFRCYVAVPKRRGSTVNRSNHLDLAGLKSSAVWLEQEEYRSSGVQEFRSSVEEFSDNLGIGALIYW
jgi:hypothetical protein